MRHLVLLLLLSFFGFHLPACTHKATPQKPKDSKDAATQASPTPTNEAAPVLTFERTPCFGTCPSYAMKVYADGRVAYEGRHAVPMMGQRELQLPAATVAAMLRQAQEAHFDQFNDRYASGATDMPSTVVAIRQPNGALKTVAAEPGAPANVQQFFTGLGHQFDALAKLVVTSDK